MGCSSSVFDDYSQSEGNADSMRQFLALRLSVKEIRKLLMIYKQIDANGSGTITKAELFAFLDLELSPFFVKVFSLFDGDSSGEVDFREFVLTVWNICTLTKHTLDCFTFEVYDPVGRGKLTAMEVTQIVYDIYGKEEALGSMRLKHIVAELKTMEKEFELITPKRFKAFALTHQALLFPAFQMQLSLQRKVLGEGSWKKHIKSRSFICDNAYVSVTELISSESQKKKKSFDGAAAANKVHPINTSTPPAPAPCPITSNSNSNSSSNSTGSSKKELLPAQQVVVNTKKDLKNRRGVTFQVPTGPNPTPRTSFASTASTNSTGSSGTDGKGSFTGSPVTPNWPTHNTTSNLSPPVVRPSSAAPGGGGGGAHSTCRPTTRENERINSREDPRRLTHSLADVPLGQLDEYAGRRQGAPASAGLASKLKRDSKVPTKKQEEGHGIFMQRHSNAGRVAPTTANKKK